ncbi:MAG: CotH kinase family protein [Planctomycetes bacterium]|nr:CotH kinase family protein [Planctomycetota bacterium]
MKALKTLFKRSWWLSLPLSLFFIYWMIQTGYRVYQYHILVEYEFDYYSLHRSGMYEFKQSIKSLCQKALGPLVSIKEPYAKTDIYLPKSKEKSLNSNLPWSGYDYKKGAIRMPDGKIAKAKIRYRGDNHHHWAIFKKSFRVKMRKNKLYQGAKTFNIISPKNDLINNRLGFDIAQRLGMMVPENYFTDLYLNGENRGIHLFTEQLREITLRRHQRMPGDMYVGEMFFKDAYPQLAAPLFQHPGIWSKIAINNHYDEFADAPIRQLCRLLAAPPTKDNQDKLLELLPPKIWGPFFAFETVAQTYHYTEGHNWRLYYDPAKSIFEPVIWDPHAYVNYYMADDRMSAHLDVMTSYFHRVLLQNYAYLHERNRILQDFFATNQDELIKKDLTEMIRRLDPYIVREYLWSADVKRNRIDIARKWMEASLKDLRYHYYEKKDQLHYSKEEKGLRLNVQGRIPIEKTRLTFSHSPSNDIRVFVHYIYRGVLKKVDVSKNIEVSGSKVTLKTPFLSRYERLTIPHNARDLKQLSMDVLPATYEIHFPDLPTHYTLNKVQVLRAGEFESVEEASEIPLVSFNEGSHIVVESKITSPEVWQGEVNIEGVKEIKGDIIIKPGCLITLEEGASLLISGHVSAKGTEKAPISFKPASKNPWGVVLLKGEGANDSELSHCTFEGGSGYKTPLREYSALFSVHDVRGLRISHCYFKNSKIVDDMVHAVYSELSMKHCRFINSLSDAVDLDICQATLENCHFQNSGNDALDLMTSEVCLYKCSMSSSGDKGVSVGERTTLFMQECSIRECHIGVQSKDTSKALLWDCNFAHNKKALDAYHKNMQYPAGGQIFLHQCEFDENELEVAAAKDSFIQLVDCRLDSSIMSQKRVEIIPTASLGNFAAGVALRSDLKSRFPFNQYWPQHILGGGSK